MNTLEEARSSFRRGWSLIPLRENSKIPALPKGHGFLTEAPTKEDYKKFDLSKNYGVVCGEMSNICVLDIDHPEGMQTIDKLDLTLPSTAEVLSPNGRHYYLKYDRKVRTGVAVVGKGVDIRSDGSFVVGPGSVVDGRSYEWYVTPEEWGELDEPPEWMKQDVKNSRVSEEKVDLTKRLGEGERNNGLVAICGRLFYGGRIDESMVYSMLSFANEQFCDPPLPQDEVERIFNSIRRYNHG